MTTFAFIANIIVRPGLENIQAQVDGPNCSLQRYKLPARNSQLAINRRHSRVEAVKLSEAFELVVEAAKTFAERYCAVSRRMHHEAGLKLAGLALLPRHLKQGTHNSDVIKKTKTQKSSCLHDQHRSR